MSANNLLQCIEFIVEMDKLKSVYRRSYVLGTNRHENDAEHCWHLSIMAIILSEYSNNQIDILRVLKMLLIHDIVEIDSGDTFCYDQDDSTFEREKIAASRIFGLLPYDQKDEYINLWKEFEKGQTEEAKFSRALDRLMPLIHNFYSEGKAWKENGIKKDQVMKRNKHIVDGSKTLWEFAESIIEKSVEKGFLKR